MIVNARFRRQSMTGVQRYAAEICNRLCDTVTEIIPPSQWGSGIRGHVWEQIVLPRSARRNVLWSPCNSGPIRCRNHVITVHDMAVFDVPEGFTASFRCLYQYLLPRLARNAAMVLTVSEFSKCRLVDVTGINPEKIVVIPNGVSTAFLADRQEDPHQSSNVPIEYAGPYLLAVGSLSPRKNISGLIDAWKRLYASGGTKTAKLFIVGGESPAVFGKNLLVNSGQFDIHFLGRVGDAKLANLYDKAICYINPSFYEGFGLPLIESFAAGCPVICSDRTAFPEVGGDVAEYFDPGNVDSIAHAIEVAIDRYQDSTIRAKQSAIVKARSKLYSWDRSADAVKAALSQVIARGE